MLNTDFLLIHATTVNLVYCVRCTQDNLALAPILTGPCHFGHHIKIAISAQAATLVMHEIKEMMKIPKKRSQTGANHVPRSKHNL